MWKESNMYGCYNCKFLKQFQSLDYYEPNETICTANEYAVEAWCDGKTWCDGETPCCNAYEYDFRKEWY